MSPQDVLPTFAEISVTILGFAGVILAFRPATAGSWSREELIRIRPLLSVPGLVLVLSLLPFGLAGFTDSPAVVWGVPLLLYGIDSIVNLALTLNRLRRGEVAFTHRARGLAIVWAQFAAAGVALLSGAGIFLPYSPGLLVLLLGWSVVATGINLLLMLVFWSRPTDGSGGAGS